MSSTLLSNELSSLVSEAKRKAPELKSAAEKALQELKALPTTSEQQLAADLSRRPTFFDPFLIACKTRNIKFATSGVACLQRLIVLRALPKSRLQDALEGFHACIDLSLDVQLKILQALPSLLQNYADILKGDLLSTILQICASLQSSKVQTVSGVAAATLQQLITSVFDSTVAEDANASGIPAITEIAGDDGPVPLRPASYDAYRVFRDLVLAAEGRKAEFVDLASLSSETALELVWSSVNSHLELFARHRELMMVVQSNLTQMVITGLSEKASFPLTLRLGRILHVIMCNYFTQLQGQLEAALSLITRMLEPDSAPLWKRVMIMEILQRFFARGNLVADAFAAFDNSQGGKPIIQDILSSFVRLSTEKPAVIGLGQQSSIPAGPRQQQDVVSEQTNLEAAGGVAGIISSAFGVVETNTAGVSSQWSLPRVRCLEQLDKSEPPSFPESYIYSLILDCLNHLSDNLAKAILPLTVAREKPMARQAHESTPVNGSGAIVGPHVRSQRSQSFRQRTVPLNPLEPHGAPAASRAQAIAGLIDACWPAVLATSSTFFNAALDDQYYRTLIKSFQRFAQVAGLLRLKTPRDALITMLGKCAVPPHVLNSVATVEGSKSPLADSPRVFSSPRSLLSVDSLVSPTSLLSADRERRPSIEPNGPILTVRNLLCLRALLNLAIALGPALDDGFGVVLGTLKSADMVLSSSSLQHMTRQSVAAGQKGSESPNFLQIFTAEVNAVEAAASRLLEATADFPNDSFLTILDIVRSVLHGKDPGPVLSPRRDSSPLPTPTKTRSFSGLPGISTIAEVQARDYQFVIPKLGTLAELNTARFLVNDPAESGWTVLTEELSSLASNESSPKEARRAATEILCNLVSSVILEVAHEEQTEREAIQRQALTVLQRLVMSLYGKESELTSIAVEVQGRILESVMSVLESAGESLVAGWDKCIAILSFAFERNEGAPRLHDEANARIDWTSITEEFVTIQLGRTAFAAVQLLCSDFIRSIPPLLGPSLIELLHRFTLQDEDLNMALTSITMTWNISDFLFSEFDIRDLESQTIPKDTHASHIGTGRAGQWLLTMIRLKDVICTGVSEVRKATFHIVRDVFKTHGDQFSPGAWDLTLRSVVLRILAADVDLYRALSTGLVSAQEESLMGEADISSILLEGVADIFARHVAVIEQCDNFGKTWQIYCGILRDYVRIGSHRISAAVYAGLSRILGSTTRDSAFWEAAAYHTASLWSTSPPHSQTIPIEKGNNQESFTNYAETATQIYRLTQHNVNLQQLQTIITNLITCIEQSDGPLNGADINHLSPLQLKVSTMIKNMRTDIEGLPTYLLEVAGQLMLLPIGQVRKKTPRPTFIAIASEAIEWSTRLVGAHISDPVFLSNRTTAGVLDNMGKVIRSKYYITQQGTGPTLWKRATSAALALAELLFEHAGSNLEAEITKSYVIVMDGIIKANGLSNVHDEAMIFNDESFDIDSFIKIKDVLLPRAGRDNVTNESRAMLTKSLFDASIVHEPELGEVPATDSSPLESLHKLRQGRLKHVPFVQRERMSYMCLRALVELSTRRKGSVEWDRLARAAAPLLVLRVAIPIRSYVVDQPLRGRQPQPLSELEELLFCLDQARNLRCHPDAFKDNPAWHGAKGEGAHLLFLYPLLVKAVAVASDKWSGAEEVLRPLQQTLEMTIPPL